MGRRGPQLRAKMVTGGLQRDSLECLSLLITIWQKPYDRSGLAFKRNAGATNGSEVQGHTCLVPLKCLVFFCGRPIKQAGGSLDAALGSYLVALRYRVSR